MVKKTYKCDTAFEFPIGYADDYVPSSANDEMGCALENLESLGGNNAG